MPHREASGKQAIISESACVPRKLSANKSETVLNTIRLIFVDLAPTQRNEMTRHDKAKVPIRLEPMSMRPGANVQQR